VEKGSARGGEQACIHAAYVIRTLAVCSIKNFFGNHAGVRDLAYKLLHGYDTPQHFLSILINSSRMVDEPRKRSRFDQTEPEPPRRSRFDRRSRSPARRSRSPAAVSSPSTVGGKDDKKVESSSKSPAPAVDPKEAALKAAAIAAKINAQLMVNGFHMPRGILGDAQATTASQVVCDFEYLFEKNAIDVNTERLLIVIQEKTKNADSSANRSVSRYVASHSPAIIPCTWATLISYDIQLGHRGQATT
jgi:hypothetical protein